MTPEPTSEEKSSPVPAAELLKFKVPSVANVDVYLVRLADGTIVARTGEELRKLREEEEKAT
jgi:hypothetical protein